MMKDVTIISNTREYCIELTHRDSDPGLWIVRRWKKFMWFKKRISSNWFSDKQQALAFAHAMKQGHDGQ